MQDCILVDVRVVLVVADSPDKVDTSDVAPGTVPPAPSRVSNLTELLQAAEAVGNAGYVNAFYAVGKDGTLRSLGDIGKAKKYLGLVS